MLIRALTAGDAALFQTLRLAALQDSPESFASTYDEEKDRALDDIAERVKRTGNQAVFGAFDAGRLVGIVGVRRDLFPQNRHKAHIWGMYVAPEARRAGLSKMLVKEAIGFAGHMSGVTELNLMAAAGNAIAIRLYRSIGFEETGRESSSIFVGEDTCDVCMRLRFTQP